MPSHGGEKGIQLTPKGADCLPDNLNWYSQPSIQYKGMCNLCCWPAHPAERDLYSAHVAFLLDVHFWMVSYMDFLKSRQTGLCYYFGFTLEERIHNNAQ